MTRSLPILPAFSPHSYALSYFILSIPIIGFPIKSTSYYSLSFLSFLVITMSFPCHITVIKI
jgi:hypothetical protein